MTAIAPMNGWAALMQQVRDFMRACGVHPAKTVVLLPFFQLQPVAREAWAVQADAQTGGFSPRFETTTSWQRRISHFVPDELDLSFDAGLDAVRARGFLRRAGLASLNGLLAPRLVEAAQQLGGLAASIEPAARPAWAQALREVVSGHGEGFASHEAAVARIALEWAAASRYASDVLLERVPGDEVQALVVVRGVQGHALADVLVRRMEESLRQSTLVLDLPQQGFGPLRVQAALDAEEEAERAAACVVAHLSSGRVPVALPAIDRLATRRISAMLAERGVAISDETGWKLSTTRAAASLMSLLRAAAPQATRDEQLAWLKACAVDQTAVQRWEQQLRKPNSTPTHMESAQDAIEFIAIDGQAHWPWRQLLAGFRKERSLCEWLSDLAQALKMSGQWTLLAQDAAGEQVLAALHWGSPQLSSEASQTILASDASRLSWGEFSAWVQIALEGASFKPPQPAKPQVVILPLAQLAARPFAAVVIAGADESRLPTSPELPGDWTAAQRQALGLPSREALAREQREVWQRAMQLPQVDVLWREAEGEAPLQASPLLRAWLLENTAEQGEDARQRLEVWPEASFRPSPSADLLQRGAGGAGTDASEGVGAMRFSASSYSDLRACPYRFFALRSLGLHESQELDEALSKRDFGAWLHAVLSDFHQQRSRDTSVERDRELLDACAAGRQEELEDAAGFVPFAASWPRIRESYLLWLQDHESKGWRFESGELDVQRELEGGVILKGRLDRVDVLAGSAAQSFAVIDYKTEAETALKKRVADPLEDTQLVFYAALLGREAVEASYLALAEKEAKSVPQTQVGEALPLFLEGVASDAGRIAQGHGLPALGEGLACEYCAARGLCRKDFWSDAQRLPSLDEGGGGA
jgi:ATP-dependent helicase/nuclease subunit B